MASAAHYGRTVARDVHGVPVMPSAIRPVHVHRKKSHFHQSSELVDAVRLMYTWTVAERASDVTAFEPQRARPSMKQNDCVYVVSVMRMHPYIRSICKLKGTVLCSRHNSRGLDLQGAQTYEAGIKF